MNQKIKFEFDLTENCVKDIEKYAKNGQLSEKDLEKIEYKANLEAENISRGRFWRSKRILGIDKHHI